MSQVVRKYEAILILDPTLGEEKSGSFMTEVADLITQQGGVVGEKISLGKRKLSFRLGKRNEGIYLQFRFEIGTDQVAALKKALGLMEGILRFMVGRESTAGVPTLVTADAPVPEGA